MGSQRAGHDRDVGGVDNNMGIFLWFQKQKEQEKQKNLLTTQSICESNCPEKGGTLRFGCLRQGQLLFGQGFWQLDF